MNCEGGMLQVIVGVISDCGSGVLQVMVGVVSEQLVSTRVMPALITLASDPDM